MGSRARRSCGLSREPSNERAGRGALQVAPRAQRATLVPQDVRGRPAPGAEGPGRTLRTVVHDLVAEPDPALDGVLGLAIDHAGTWGKVRASNDGATELLEDRRGSEEAG